MAKLKITTLIIGDEGDINGVYHSVKTTKKEIEKDLVNQVLEDDDYDEDEIKKLQSIKR